MKYAIIFICLVIPLGLLGCGLITSVQNSTETQIVPTTENNQEIIPPNENNQEIIPTIENTQEITQNSTEDNKIFVSEYYSKQEIFNGWINVEEIVQFTNQSNESIGLVINDSIGDLYRIDTSESVIITEEGEQYEVKMDRYVCGSNWPSNIPFFYIPPKHSVYIHLEYDGSSCSEYKLRYSYPELLHIKKIIIRPGLVSPSGNVKELEVLEQTQTPPSDNYQPNTLPIKIEYSNGYSMEIGQKIEKKDASYCLSVKESNTDITQNAGPLKPIFSFYSNGLLYGGGWVAFTTDGNRTSLGVGPGQTREVILCNTLSREFEEHFEYGLEKGWIMLQIVDSEVDQLLNGLEWSSN